MCAEHPLLVYIEDPFANHDFKGYQKMTAKFKTNASQVRICLKSMLKDGIHKL